MSPRRTLLALLLVALAAAACDAPGGYLAEQGRRHRLAELGVEPFDSTGTYKLAGVSTVKRIEIPKKLDARRLGRDTLDPAFNVFRTRCRACHELPAPDAKPAYLWDATLSRMKKNAADAGLMPWSATDEAAIRGFLEEHAADRN